MKNTHKLLCLMLVLVTVCALLSVGISGEEVTPVQATLIDESGALEGSVDKAAGLPEDANPMYLADWEPESTSGYAHTRNKAFTPNNNWVFTAPGTVWQLTTGKSYNKLNADGTESTAKCDPGYMEAYVNNQIYTFYREFIYLGGNGTHYEYGIGVTPTPAGKTADTYQIYDVTGQDYFYAVVGCNGKYNVNPTAEAGKYTLTFEVWGGADTTNFVKLAYVEGLQYWYTAEFNVDISAYNYIKLVVTTPEDYDQAADQYAQYYRSGAWGNACAYTVGVPETTEPTVILPTATVEPTSKPINKPSTNTDPTPTEDTSSPVGLIIGIAAAVLVVAGVVVVIIIKKKKAA